MKIGAMHWVELSARGGHAQSARRPAIIIQDPAVSAKLPTVLIVPLTSQQDALRFPGTVLVEADAQNKLRHVSVALVFQLTAIDKRFVTDRIGDVSETVLELIWSAPDELMGRL